MSKWRLHETERAMDETGEDRRREMKIVGSREKEER